RGSFSLPESRNLNQRQTEVCRTFTTDLVAALGEAGAIPATILKLKHRIPFETVGFDRAPVVGDGGCNPAGRAGTELTHVSIHHCPLVEYFVQLLPRAPARSFP